MKRNAFIYIIMIINILCLVSLLVDNIILLEMYTKQYISIFINLLIVISLLIFDIIFLTLHKFNVRRQVDQYRFVTDSIHSLRTPLTVIQANLDFMSLDGENKYINNIRDEANKIEMISGNLINYSKLKEDIFNICSKVDMSKLVNIECEKVKLLYNNLFIDFNYNIEENIFWLTNSAKMMIVVTTLLDNASKYSIKSVECNLTSSYFEVINDTTLDDGDYISLFERFKREQNDVKGFGVGLSIVSLACEIYKIKITANVVNSKMIIKLNKKGISI